MLPLEHFNFYEYYYVVNIYSNSILLIFIKFDILETLIGLATLMVEYLNKCGQVFHLFFKEDAN